MLREILNTAARQLLVYVVRPEVSPHVLVATRLELAALERGRNVEALTAYLGGNTRLVAPRWILLDWGVSVLADIVLL